MEDVQKHHCQYSTFSSCMPVEMVHFEVNHCPLLSLGFHVYVVNNEASFYLLIIVN